MGKTGAQNLVRKWINGELKGKIIDDPHQVVSKMINGLVISMKEKR